MNIIEAFQSAEKGKLITNNFLKTSENYLKYEKSGIFQRYMIINGRPVYQYSVNQFIMSEILSTGWEIFYLEDLI